MDRKRLRQFLQFLFLINVLLSSTSLSWAAISFDAKSNSQCDGCSSLTISHTCTGSNLLLVVNASGEDTAGNTVSVSSITYNGVNLTKVNSAQASTSPGTEDEIEQWYLLNPSTGTNNIVITWTRAVGIGGSGVIGEGISYTGVKQSSQPDAQISNTGSSPTITGTVTTVAGNAMIVDAAMEIGSTATISANSPQTGRVNVTNVGSHVAGMSEYLLATPGSQAMAWTINSSQKWGTVVASYAPALTGQDTLFGATLFGGTLF